VHPDHLGTPRLVTNGANQVRWRWSFAEPFGASPANENPSALGVIFLGRLKRTEILFRLG
jgi:uncharacterized protein RhaS with RHS repeats